MAATPDRSSGRKRTAGVRSPGNDSRAVRRASAGHDIQCRQAEGNCHVREPAHRRRSIWPINRTMRRLALISRLRHALASAAVEPVDRKPAAPTAPATDAKNGPASAVDVLDLLGRKPVNLHTPELQRFLAGKVVLVTGAGGSIGSEI